MFIARVTKRCAEPQRGEMSAVKHATPTELKTRLDMQTINIPPLTWINQKS